MSLYFCFLEMERGDLCAAGFMTPLFASRLHLTWAIPPPETGRSHVGPVVIRDDIRADSIWIYISAPKPVLLLSPWRWAPPSPGAESRNWGSSLALSSCFLPCSLFLSSWTTLVPFLFTATAIAETVIILVLEVVPISSLVSGPLLSPAWSLHSAPE